MPLTLIEPHRNVLVDGIESFVSRCIYLIAEYNVMQSLIAGRSILYYNYYVYLLHFAHICIAKQPGPGEIGPVASRWSREQRRWVV